MAEYNKQLTVKLIHRIELGAYQTYQINKNITNPKFVYRKSVALKGRSMSRMKTEQVSNNEQKIIENGQLNLNLIKKSYTLTNRTCQNHNFEKTGQRMDMKSVQ